MTGNIYAQIGVALACWAGIALFIVYLSKDD